MSTANELAESYRSSLDRVTHHLSRLKRRTPRYLQPGLTRTQVKVLAAALPMKLTPDLVALYSVCNGTKTGRRKLDDLWLFPGEYFLSLEEAITAYESLRDAPQWKAGRFPVFASGGGDYLYVVCKERASRGVYGLLRGEPKQPMQYASLPAMFETLAACYEEGAFFVKRGNFDIDDDLMAAVARRINPRLPYWKEGDKATEVAEAERNARGKALAAKAHRLLTRERKPLAALEAYEEAIALRDYHTGFYVNALCALNLAHERRPLDPQRIRRMLNHVLGKKRHHPDAFWNAACAWLHLGETDKCIDSLRTAKRRGVDMKRCLRDKTFAPIRDDKRFIALKKSSM